jgi:hypothetical protein
MRLVTSFCVRLTTSVLATLLLLVMAMPGVRAGCWITPDSSGHVDIPEGTTSIAGDAFRDCADLLSVSFP